jgi:hypothetical protein
MLSGEEYQMQITLNTGSLAMMDLKEPFVLPDALDFEIVSPVYRLNTLVLTARNGDVVEQIKLDKKPFKNELKKTLFAGKIEIEISLLVKGDIVKTWRLPDIIIKETKYTFEAIPEIEELKNEISKLKQGFAEILKLIK